MSFPTEWHGERWSIKSMHSKMAKTHVLSDGTGISGTVRQPVQRIRLIDIAEVAGVSRTVAGRVLNGGDGNSRVGEDTAKRILEVAEKMQYKPNPAARQLRGKRTQTYGVLVASAGDPLRSFLVQQLDIEAFHVGCHTIIGNTIGRDEPNHFGYYVDELSRRGVDGMFCAVHEWFAGDRQNLVDQHPNSIFYENPGIPDACYVEVDRYGASRMAVEHLVKSGRRRIGLALTNLSKPTCQSRRQGYLDELSAHGLSVQGELSADQSFIFNGESLGAIHAEYNEVNQTWNYPVEAIDRVVDVLVRDGGVDAIVAHDDFLAATLIKRLRSRGISVPHDVAIVGYLNHYLADWTDPALTTIDLQHGQAAKLMIRMMERLINDESIPKEDRVVTIKPRLIVREST